MLGAVNQAVNRGALKTERALPARCSGRTELKFGGTDRLKTAGVTRDRDDVDNRFISMLAKRYFRCRRASVPQFQRTAGDLHDQAPTRDVLAPRSVFLGEVAA